MASSDANPPMPEFRDDYVLVEVDNDYLDSGWLAASSATRSPR